MSDVSKVVFSVVMIAIALTIVWYGAASTILGVSAMGLVGAATYLGYDGVANMRAIARRAARQRLRVASNQRYWR